MQTRMERYSPSPNKLGEAIREPVYRMARRNKAQKNLKTDARLTPFDVKTKGTFAELPALPKEGPRKTTPEEMYANNHAKVELGRAIGNVSRMAEVFKSDLEDMNRGKRGRPFLFSDTLIIWMLSFFTVFNCDYRLVAGFTESLLRDKGVETPSFSRFHERVRMLKDGLLLPEDSPIRMKHKGVLAVKVCNNVTDRVRRVGIDSTGINLSDTTYWRVNKWHQEKNVKGWLILHALSDVDSGEILAYAVSDDSVRDSPMLRILVEEAKNAGHRFDTVYADNAYAGVENWKFLCQENKYRFVTAFSVSTSPTNNGCLARGEAARLWCSLPYDRWVEESGYGTRWKCECVFSDFKRLFPETVTARKQQHIVAQISSRVDEFNDYKMIRAGLMHTTGNGVTIA